MDTTGGSVCFSLCLSVCLLQRSALHCIPMPSLFSSVQFAFIPNHSSFCRSHSHSYSSTLQLGSALCFCYRKDVKYVTILPRKGRTKGVQDPVALRCNSLHSLCSPSPATPILPAFVPRTIPRQQHSQQSTWQQHHRQQQHPKVPSKVTTLLDDVPTPSGRAR